MKVVSLTCGSDPDLIEKFISVFVQHQAEKQEIRHWPHQQTELRFGLLPGTDVDLLEQDLDRIGQYRGRVSG